MSVDTSAVDQPIAVTEEAVQVESNRLLAVAAAKHGLAISEIPADVRERATAEARALLEANARNQNSPMAKMYDEARQRAELAEAQLKALRESHIRPEGNVIVETAERARARAGEVGWSRMTVEQRLASIGVDHTIVDKAELSQLFGKNSDHKRASDLHRTDQRRYKTLKETAKVLGIY
jgi:hypothetical protein